MNNTVTNQVGSLHTVRPIAHIRATWIDHPVNTVVIDVQDEDQYTFGTVHLDAAAAYLLGRELLASAEMGGHVQARMVVDALRAMDRNPKTIASSTD